MMTNSTLFGVLAIVTQLGPVAVCFRTEAKCDRFYWLSILVAVLVSSGVAFSRIMEAWHIDFSTALWVTIATVMAVFSVAAAMTHSSWRLSPIIFFYMILLATVALFSNNTGDNSLHSPLNGWIFIHIFTSLLTYSLVTIAAVSAVAAVLQETALKTKRRGYLANLLPSLVDADFLTNRYLLFGEIILGVGLVTGISINWISEHVFLKFDHKTVLTISAFLIIGCLLFVQQLTGLRGRQAARVILVAYLLLTLGYLGVKFVTDIILV